MQLNKILNKYHQCITLHKNKLFYPIVKQNDINLNYLQMILQNLLNRNIYF